jgi:hypothetical protein
MAERRGGGPSLDVRFAGVALVRSMTGLGADRP